METFKYNDEIIEYNIERKKIKNFYISVKDAIVTVKVPMKTSNKKIEELIQKRAEWIIKNVKKQERNKKSPMEYVDGDKFKVLGKDVVLNIIYDKIKKPKLRYFFNKFIVILPIECEEKAQDYVKELIEHFYDKLAEKEIEKAMRKMAMKVGIAPKSYKIKKLKSTWGNCSTKANISISRNLVMYSRHAIEYVCLHEICHLQNMNHSKNFWCMVEKYMPNYKEAEEELKE